MNMETSFDKLWRHYQQPTVDEAAALAPAKGPEYGEPHMEQYRRYK